MSETDNVIPVTSVAHDRRRVNPGTRRAWHAEDAVVFHTKAQHVAGYPVHHRHEIVQERRVIGVDDMGVDGNEIVRDLQLRTASGVSAEARGRLFE